MSNNARLKISLFDNGTHSFWKGIKAIDGYVHPGMEWNLKEGVMYIHHGVELLLKEMLVRQNPYLIFDDLQDVAKKQQQADQQNNF